VDLVRLESEEEKVMSAREMVSFYGKDDPTIPTTFFVIYISLLILINLISFDKT